MAIKNKTGLAAIVTTVAAFIFILIAFSTPYWLQNDEKIDNPQFIKIGKWNYITALIISWGPAHSLTLLIQLNFL